jgi:16S rRNA processing protein RimM
MSDTAPPEWIILGRIMGVFGVRGQLKVQSYTDPVESLLDYEYWRLQFPGGKVEPYRLLEGRRGGKGLVVYLEGIGDCDVARLLVGADVLVARSELPEPEKGEFYQADLIGLKVMNEEGKELGRVAHFLEMPAHAVMVVRGETEHWLPVTPQHLRRVDLKAGEVWVNWDPTVLE